MASDFLPGFDRHRIETGPGVTINARSAGSGPPVLLLHGHPQTLSTWLHVAPRLAERHSRRGHGPARLRRFGQAPGR